MHFCSVPSFFSAAFPTASVQAAGMPSGMHQAYAAARRWESAARIFPACSPFMASICNVRSAAVVTWSVPPTTPRAIATCEAWRVRVTVRSNHARALERVVLTSGARLAIPWHSGANKWVQEKKQRCATKWLLFFGSQCSLASSARRLRCVL